MLAQVSDERMVAIPEEIGRRLGIEPGDRLDWTLVEGSDAVLVRRVTDRGALARRLCGLGKNLAPDRDLATEIDAEHEREDQDRLRSLGA
ncbi:MAG: AbrB/MazE/SpoVT family DNA-binding domain-containing protein [Lamprocystis purpurea]|uniref:AbrB/MazE/SpoVT family DNA-binding domain-containing protein n=1 Tax=Lamprocystis purpurea TaxID=61598 RepID=UPI001B7FDAFC|nr:AbrB/MazE/SpoVT family DNA-binding domain-containing protein [Lamprocystis purpurea]MBV5276159.1 AbrB/MazE/SpoVT family DNA-binding domain-containing protein [Lamprocystis purpurea]